jgi:hypothetical protein
MPIQLCTTRENQLPLYKVQLTKLNGNQYWAKQNICLEIFHKSTSFIKLDIKT